MTARPLSLRRWAAALVCVSLLAPPAPAAADELKPKTLDTFNRYVALTETRMDAEVASADAFLWVDGLAEPRRAKEFAKLRRGKVLSEKLKTLDNRQEIKDSDGRIHHWVAMVFIPGAKLNDVLGLMQNYDNYAEFFKKDAFFSLMKDYNDHGLDWCKPEVARSKVLSRDGNDFRTEMRIVQKLALDYSGPCIFWIFCSTPWSTYVLDMEQEIHYVPLDAARVRMRTVATHIVPVENADKSSERQLPPSGMLWRYNTYWRFQERDGGTYVQCEIAALSRRVSMFVSPYYRVDESFARVFPAFLLGTMRGILLERQKSTAKP